MNAGQLPLEFEHQPAFGRADFVVAEANRGAVAWLDRWPDWPAPALALAGPPACGKTHLASIWAERAGAKLMSSRELVGSPEVILQGRRSVVIDAADEGVDERTLLHLYNHLAEISGHLLLTGRLPPARWPIRLPDLHSRLAAIPVAFVQSPDEVLLEAVLIKLFADRQLRVAPEIVSYLIPRIERSFGAMQDVVGKIDRVALTGHRNVSLILVRSVLDGNDQGAK